MRVLIRLPVVLLLVLCLAGCAAKRVTIGNQPITGQVPPPKGGGLLLAPPAATGVAESEPQPEAP